MLLNIGECLVKSVDAFVFVKLVRQQRPRDTRTSLMRLCAHPKRHWSNIYRSSDTSRTEVAGRNIKSISWKLVFWLVTRLVWYKRFGGTCCLLPCAGSWYHKMKHFHEAAHFQERYFSHRGGWHPENQPTDALIKYSKIEDVKYHSWHIFIYMFRQRGVFLPESSRA
jgi:hypothetical protein